VTGHTLKTWFSAPDKKWIGKCSCGWMSFGKTDRQVRASWQKRHIEKLNK